MIILKPANTNENNRLQRQFTVDQRVRRAAVYIQLLYLKEYHAGYRDIKIDTVALSKLPINGDVSDQFENIKIGTVSVNDGDADDAQAGE